MHVNRPNNLQRREEDRSKVSPLVLLSLSALLVFCLGVVGLPFRRAEGAGAQRDYYQALDRADAQRADTGGSGSLAKGELPIVGPLPQTGGRSRDTEPGNGHVPVRPGNVPVNVAQKGGTPVRSKPVPPKPTAKPVAKSYRRLALPPEAEQWKWDIGNRIIAAWGGGELGHKAAAIAFAESSYNCGNTTGDKGRSWGLFQINIAHKKRWTSKGWDRTALKDCWKNQEIAKEIYREQGWGPWGAATHPIGHPRYLQFLK